MENKFEVGELVIVNGVFAQVVKLNELGEISQILINNSSCALSNNKEVYKLTFNRLKVVSFLFTLLGVLIERGIENVEEEQLKNATLANKLFKYSENEEIFNDLYATFISNLLKPLNNQ